MMQFNPFLASIAAPAAAKTVQAVVHVAQEASQGFLRTLNQFRDVTAASTEAVAAESATLSGQLQSVASSFRSWLGQQGITSPFEMQFSVGANGDPIANVVGSESAKIVDLLYSNDAWLEKLSSLATRATKEATAAPLGISAGSTAASTGTSSQRSVKLAISSDDAYMIRDATLAF